MEKCTRACRGRCVESDYRSDDCVTSKGSSTGFVPFNIGEIDLDRLPVLRVWLTVTPAPTQLTFPLNYAATGCGSQVSGMAPSPGISIWAEHRIYPMRFRSVWDQVSINRCVHGLPTSGPRPYKNSQNVYHQR